MRNVRRVMFDVETCGLASDRLLYIKQPTSPSHLSKVNYKIPHIPLPPIYRFNATNYDILSYHIDVIKAMSKFIRLPIITATQQPSLSQTLGTYNTSTNISISKTYVNPRSTPYLHDFLRVGG